MNELVVLVPAMQRPHNVAPLVASFAASDTPGRLLFLIDALDLTELHAIQDAGAEHLCAPEISWPQRINFGYRHTTERWILCAADDVYFHSGWFQATKPLRELGYSVIGTNDLGNPRVQKGEHSTHSLVRRSYADEFGTLDGPGAIVCEEYRHWFVDDELIATAKARDAWAFCKRADGRASCTRAGKGHLGSVYALGEHYVTQDFALWRERSQKLSCMNPSSRS